MANTLFPETEAFQTDKLRVSNIHELYFEQSGNKNGKPVIVLHGGPGAGVSPKQRQYFDPEFYRIILFDQRGSGKSTPQAELRENTTWDLIADIEQIRKLLGIEKWLVFGGSWGSTLALAYAITHPERVVGLIMRGIFLCRQMEIDWLYQSGASFVYPDAWEDYLAPIPEAERGNMVQAYYKRLTSEDRDVRIPAAKAWSIWEAATSHLYQDQGAIADFENDPDMAVMIARIECHYFINKAFFETDQFLLEKAPTINHIPTRIVQGRYDMVCPVRSAWDLCKAMPAADLRIVPDAGHAGLEPGNLHELIQATQEFKKYFH